MIGLVYAGGATDIQAPDFGIFLEIVQGLSEPPSTRGVDTVTPGRPGRVAGSRVADRLQIRLEGVVIADDEAAFRTSMMALRRLFHPTRMPAPLTATLEDGGVVSVMARPVRIEARATSRQSAEVSVELEGLAVWAPPAPPPGTVLLDYGSVWRYAAGAYGLEPGFEAPGYDDSGWASGAAPFGGYVGWATRWEESTDIVLRARIAVAPGTPSLSIVYGIDNNALVYLDGALVGSAAHSGYATPADQSIAVPHPAPGPSRVLAVRGTDLGSVAYFDMRVTVGP
jgi:hypothetical protein